MVCRVPEQWHMHKIIPIFKSGDLNIGIILNGDLCSVRNYCPISLLSNTSKVAIRTSNFMIKLLITLAVLRVLPKMAFSRQTDVLYFDKN